MTTPTSVAAGALNASYPAIYRDIHGEEQTIIYNDGAAIRMTVRGVTFTGSGPDAFAPTLSPDDPRLASFTLHQYPHDAVELCRCEVRYDVPVPINTPDGSIEGTLTVHMEMGVPAERGGLDREILTLTLRIGENSYAGSGTSGWFEDELLEIQRMLPEGVFMRACINCAFSDYSVYGHGIYGNMMCFRDQKQAYLKVRTKNEYMSIWGFTETVQETYCALSLSVASQGRATAGDMVTGRRLYPSIGLSHLPPSRLFLNNDRMLRVGYVEDYDTVVVSSSAILEGQSEPGR